MAYSYKLPDWCYDENHILIDVQHLKAMKEILYIFKDNNGISNYYKTSAVDKYFYTNNILFENSNMIESMDNLHLRFDKKGMSEGFGIYEGDVQLELKHSVDYRYTRKKDECKYKLKILFWDIEVYTGDNREFPFPLQAKYPINAISFKLNSDDKIYSYICKLDNMDSSEIKIPDNVNFTLFDNEKDLIISFCNKIRELNVDILAAWNGAYFDEPYIFNRMNKLGIDPDILSPINCTDINISEFGENQVYGIYLLDQLKLYQKLVTNKKDSYKLSAIAQAELGKDKIAYEGSLNDLYEQDINKFILYSTTDTELLFELEEKLKHIDLRYEMIKICSSTWKRAETTSGLLDPLFIRFAKDKNMACRNRNKSEHSETFSGAYVLEPKIGLHKWLVDFDFKSLYPSIICTFNIGPNTYIAKISEDDVYNYLYDFENLNDEIQIKYDPLKAQGIETTINKNDFKKYINDNNYIVAITGCIFKNHKHELSFFNEILLYLMNSRDEYKKKLGKCRELLNDTTLSNEQIDSLNFNKQVFDLKQITYKIIANSIYGSLGNRFFRLYNIDMAKTVTSTGREALKFSVKHLSKYMKDKEINYDYKFLENFETVNNEYIVYGDSVTKDSLIYINNNIFTIEQLWDMTNKNIINKNGKEVKQLSDIKVLSSLNHKNIYLNATEIIRHKVNKKIYRVYVNEKNHIDVTEDHGIINYDDDLNYITTPPINCKYVLMNKTLMNYCTNNIVQELFNDIKYNELINTFDEIAMKVQKVEEIEYVDYVYDLCVPETQKFYSNNILVHNTDSMFVGIGDYLIDNDIL